MKKLKAPGIKAPVTRSLKTPKKIKSGLRIKWTPEIKNYVKKNAKKARTLTGLAETASAYFGMTFTKSQISNFLWREGILRGQKEFIKPLYSEKRNGHGYIIIKTSMTGPKEKQWQEKHRWVWEQSNGKIPAGMNIIFLDNNRFNFALENLAMISKAERVKLSQFELRSGNREITLAGIAVVKHLLAVHGCLNKSLGPKEHKRFINRNWQEAKKRRIET